MRLAINGGKKIRTKPLPSQQTIGRTEMEAVERVLDRDILSGYRGNFTEAFWGGAEVQALEKQFSEKFNVEHSLAVNSCTSALIIACGAIGIKPGDEVIVTPWSMSCSATAPMIYGATPVFADIEEDYFCLDVKSVEKKITKKTKAIIIVDLFGQPADIELFKLAKKHGLYIIEDAAQAIGSKYKEEYAGKIGDISCFSFTQGKHITAGEGGMIVTDDDELAFKCALIRNHAEAVVENMGGFYQQHNNLVGFNMRMTEIQAAILQEQLKKLDKIIDNIYKNVERIRDVLSNIPILKPTSTRENCTHVYYVQSWKYNHPEIHRNKFIEAVKAELTGEEKRIDRGVPIGCGYIKPLYRFPLFNSEERLFMVEKLWKDELVVSLLHLSPLVHSDIQDISDAFHKVYENMGELK